MNTATIPALGTTRDYVGVTFTAETVLETFDHKPRGIRWRAGPGVSVDEHCIGGTDHPFRAQNIHCKTFASAAHRAIVSRVREVRRAEKLVAEYQSEPADYRQLLETLAEG